VSARLLVLGATGRTGRELVAQARERGHDVTVLVRDPGRLDPAPSGVRVVTGGLADPAALDDALEGRDAVLCALGPRSPAALLRCRLMRDSMDALLPAMERRGARRLVLLSALGAGRSAAVAPRPLRLAFRTLLRTVGRDKAASEEAIRASAVDWTIVYPPALTDGPRTGRLRTGDDLHLRGVPKVSRADLADFMLSQVENAAFSRRDAIVSA
jgi:putative NADH-flavin reductase